MASGGCGLGSRLPGRRAAVSMKMASEPKVFLAAPRRPGGPAARRKPGYVVPAVTVL